MKQQSINPQLLDSRHWQALKEDGRIAVYKSQIAGEAPVVLKVYKLDGLLARLGFLRKQRKLQRFHQAMAQRLSMPALLAAGVLGDGKRGYFCFQHLQGEDFRRLPWGDSASDLERLQQAAKLLAVLHRADWSHGDFKFGNLFSAEGKLWLLDTESVRAASTSRNARDVARFMLNGLELGLAGKSLQTFWQTYCEHAGAENAGLKSATQGWLQKLAQRHSEKYARAVDLTQLNFLD